MSSTPALGTEPVRVDVLVDRDGKWEDGFYVAQGRYISGGLAVAVGDYSKSPNGESTTSLRCMSPDTARRLAAEIAAMADIVEDAMLPISTSEVK